MRIESWRKPKRDDFIKQLRDVPSDRKHALEFQGRVQLLPVHTVPIDMPCYRLNNGRTRAAQREWVVVHRKSQDFFEDPDSAPALDAQHQILRGMAGKEGLLDILKSGRQDEPLILDQAGYIVNGNRRVCVMRMLLEEDPAAYERYQHVDVAFLPGCSEDDVRELEAKLQVRREGKAEYTWVTLAMMYRELREATWDDKRTAARYDKRPPQVRESIQMLDDAEAYLEDRGRAGHYSLVNDMQYAFRQLVKTRRKCGRDEDEKALVTHLAYAMMDSPAEAGDRLYGQIPDVHEHIDVVADELRKELSGSIPAEKPDESVELLGGASESAYRDLVAPVADRENRETVLRVVRDTLEEARATRRRHKTARYCAERITAALTALRASINGWDEKTDTTGISEALDGIDDAVAQVRERLDQ